MKLIDLKYLAAYIFPLVAAYGIYRGGMYSYFILVLAFGVIPVLEQILASSKSNLSESQVVDKKANRFFDNLLYLNVLIVYGLCAFFIYTVLHASYTQFELVGLTLTLGFILGTSGINVAHELGHRQDIASATATKLLLLPSLYMHFTIEHNYGHHLWVATPKDPATARKNEWLFAFWLRSTSMSYINAWRLESKRLNGSPLTWKNQMIWFSLIQGLWMLSIFFFFGTSVLIMMVGAAIFSFLLLETINYIEHYGLRRTQLASGRYEHAQPKHSWNSNHYLGRIMLYELTRHSDHHYKANKKYQLLNHHESSPQLPMGYPAAMITAMFPPLWFMLINPRLRAL